MNPRVSHCGYLAGGTLVIAPILLLLTGCAGPSMVAPRTPILIERVVESTALANPDPVPDPPPAGAGPEITQRPGEIAIAEHAFKPRLQAAFKAYLQRELGERYANRALAVSRMSVKIRVMNKPSEPVNVGTVYVPPQPGVSPAAAAGAGLVGALIAGAIIDGMNNAGAKALVLASVEGDYGGLAFAGFSYAEYSAEIPHTRIEDAVLGAFAQAANSLKMRLTQSGAEASRRY